MYSEYPRFIGGICNNTPSFWVCTDLEEEEEEAEEDEGGEEEEVETLQETRHWGGLLKD